MKNTSQQFSQQDQTKIGKPLNNVLRHAVSLSKKNITFEQRECAYDCPTCYRQSIICFLLASKNVLTYFLFIGA
jgi:hypothetical protein